MTTGFNLEDYVRKQCVQEPWCTVANGHIKFGKIHKDYHDMVQKMPDGMPGKDQHVFAAELAQQIYGQQAVAALDPFSMDDEKLKDWCENIEPWTAADRVEDITSSVLGYAVEKLVHARNLFTKESPEFAVFDELAHKAQLIYAASIERMAERYAAGKPRAQAEEMNARLFQFWHKNEANGTFIAHRMDHLTQRIGDIVMRQSMPRVKPDSYEKLTIRNGRIVDADAPEIPDQTQILPPLKKDDPTPKAP